MPIDRAVPAIVRIAASRSVVLRSGIFVVAMSLSCFWEILPTLILFGSFEPEPGFFAVASIEVMLSFLKNVLFILPAGIGVQDVGYVSCLAALGVPDALNMGAAFSVLKRGKELFWATFGYALLASEARPALATPRLGVDAA